MLWGIMFASAVGYVCARMERKALEDKLAGLINFAALYYAVWATLLAMSVANDHFETHTLPWVWTLGAVVVALIAGVLRVREIGWAAHLPLAFAQATFYMAKFEDRSWELAPALALVAVTLGFGFFLWGRARAEEDRTAATSALWPYAFLAVAVALVATWDHCPERWQLTAFAAETLALVLAGTLAEEGVFIWLSILPMAVGAAGYLFSDREVFSAQATAWANLLIGLALFVFAERVLGKGKAFQELCVAIVVIVTGLALFALDKLVSGALLTFGWALLGFVLLAIGFAVKHRPWRMAGLVALAFSLARAVFHDMARVETIYRILSFIGLGVILLVLGYLYAKNREKLAKWL
jgi:uncharacterized membrane protein